MVHRVGIVRYCNLHLLNIDIDVIPILEVHIQEIFKITCFFRVQSGKYKKRNYEWL